MFVVVVVVVVANCFNRKPTFRVRGQAEDDRGVGDALAYTYICIQMYVFVYISERSTFNVDDDRQRLNIDFDHI